MQWYEGIEKKLITENKYSHKELVEELKTLNPTLSDSTYQWVIGNLLRDGKICRLGYDAYSKPGTSSKKEYYPDYSDLALELISKINETYPYVKFTIFETVMMNAFLNHLIAQNTIFVQVEKECSIYVFRFLQENGYQNIMYKPSLNEFELYWAKDGIVVTDLISEAPLRTKESYVILLEKMLVDMCVDKLILNTYSKAEIPDVIEQAQSCFRLDKTRLLRYARRRNREKEMKKYLEGSNAENVIA